MPTEDWRYTIEIHPRAWQCPATDFWIAGSIATKSGRPPADVRAWLGGRSFLGLCGLPRPDLDNRWAGFSFLLTPTADARDLRLEACDDSGRWQEFHRQPVSVASGAPPASPPTTDVARVLLGLLAARVRRPSASWTDLADDELTAGYSVPLETLPNPPLHGALEQPAATGFVRYGRIAITGWLAHRDKRIQRLTACIEPTSPVALVAGLPRDDVTGQFAGLRDATMSRFAGYIEVPPALPRPVSLRIFVEYEDGRIELAFTRRFHPQTTTGAAPELPTLSRFTFWQAQRALRSAARARGWSMGDDATFETARRQAWAGYESSAPFRARPLRENMVPAAAAEPKSGRRVVVVTHNLNFEGAPLIAFEHARYLASLPGWSVEVVSTQDGPLKARFKAAGLPTTFFDGGPLFAAAHRADFERELDRIVTHPCWNGVDLIIANTMVSFWAVHLAARLGRPSLLYVHESTGVRQFFAPFGAPALLPLIEEAFGLATRTVFSARAAAAVHARLERAGNYRVIPGWIDLAGIPAQGDPLAKANHRRACGLPAGGVIFANIGAISDRKGQHVWVEAIDLFLQGHRPPDSANPAPVFLMVGATPSPYLDVLRADIARRGLTSVRIIDQVSDPHPYFAAADIFVCSSFEEALPRVILEAAAFGLPIVSTNVNGIPEILPPGAGWLVPPGDARALAQAMAAALEAQARNDRTRADRASREVREHFATDTLLPLHAALALSVCRNP